eukprot:Gb_28091 [translate_table: standard]
MVEGSFQSLNQNIENMIKELWQLSRTMKHIMANANNWTNSTHHSSHGASFNNPFANSLGGGSNRGLLPQPSGPNRVPSPSPRRESRDFNEVPVGESTIKCKFGNPCPRNKNCNFLSKVEVPKFDGSNHVDAQAWIHKLDVFFNINQLVELEKI